jgi:hypothetical protein
VERLSGLTRFRFHFGPMAILFVVLLPLLSPALLLVLETLWAVVWIVAIVGFALVTHFMEPMAIEVGSEAVTLRRGLSGWFGAVRVPIQDVKRVSLEDCVNGFKQLKLETASDSLSASRVIGVMEAEWLQAEVRRAIAAAGGERS